MSSLLTARGGTSRMARQRDRRPGRRGWLRRRPVVLAIRLVTFVVVIGLWQLYGENVNRALFAPPSEVFASLIKQFTTEPSLLEPLGVTFLAFGIGMALGVAVGIPLGLLVGRYRAVEFVLDPYVTFLYVIPSVAFVPLFVLWFGFDFKFQVALVFESTIFPVMINAAAGAKNVESDLVDGGRSFQASEWQIMRTIIVPASLPFVFAGLRIAFSAAWVGVVVAQMTGALTGLGGLIKIYASVYRTADMLVPILVIMVVGVLIHALTSWLLARLTPWHQAQLDTETDQT
jgi:ABC-type nitrate/sulfonate/bicarbonate transport system permease component